MAVAILAPGHCCQQTANYVSRATVASALRSTGPSIQVVEFSPRQPRADRTVRWFDNLRALAGHRTMAGTPRTHDSGRSGGLRSHGRIFRPELVGQIQASARKEIQTTGA